MIESPIQLNQYPSFREDFLRFTSTTVWVNTCHDCARLNLFWLLRNSRRADSITKHGNDSDLAGPREESINLQNAEENAKKRHRRRFLKAAIVVVSVLLVAFTVGVSTRLKQPTRPGWQLMPLKQGNFFPKNVMIWMVGRCYAQRPLVKAVSEAGRLLKKQCPGAGIAYQVASGRKGGKLLGHLSHKCGRDIDICFIGRDLQGRLYPERPSY